MEKEMATLLRTIQLHSEARLAGREVPVEECRRLALMGAVIFGRIALQDPENDKAQQAAEEACRGFLRYL